MSTPEKKVKDKIVAMLKAANVYYFFPVASGFGSAGLFDIVACRDGKMVGLEVKATEKDVPTLLRTKNAITAYRSGAFVMCVHAGNVDHLQAWLAVHTDFSARGFFWWNARALELYKLETGDEFI